MLRVIYVQFILLYLFWLHSIYRLTNYDNRPTEPSVYTQFVAAGKMQTPFQHILYFMIGNRYICIYVYVCICMHSITKHHEYAIDRLYVSKMDMWVIYGLLIIGRARNCKYTSDARYTEIDCNWVLLLNLHENWID